VQHTVVLTVLTVHYVDTLVKIDCKVVKSYFLLLRTLV